MSLLTSVEAASRLLWDVSLKATVLLIVAWLAVAMLSRSSAAIRHRVWSLTMIGLVLLPALSWWLPVWHLPVLPAAAEVEMPQPVAAVPLEPAVSSPLDGAVNEASYDVTPWEEPAADHDMPAIAIAAEMPSAPPVISEPFGPIPWLAVSLVGVWLIGSVACCCGIVLGLRHVRRLSRQSTRFGDEEWRVLINDLRTRLGLRQAVELREYFQPIVPLTWGFLRPRVLLPSQARTWSEPMRRSVLLHELAHVQRADVAYQLLGRLACAMYWFHPLAWLALRQMRQEREQACDDAVLHTGEQASTYAEQLLEVARLYCRPGGFSLAVEMAQGSSLEHRLRALFDAARSHSPLNRKWALGVFVMTALCLCTVAVIRPAAMDTNASAEEDKNEDRESDERQNQVPRADQDKLRQITIRGICSGDDSEPLANVRVRVFRYPSLVDAPILAAESKTDEEGRFRFEGVETVVDPTPFHGLGDLMITATQEGRSSGIKNLRKAEEESEVSLVLSDEAATLSGTVTDNAGRPVPGVTVTFPGPWSVPLPGVFTALTDGTGRYAIRDCRESHAGVKPVESQEGVMLANMRCAIHFHHPDFPVTTGWYSSIPQKLNVTLQPPAIVEGRVMDAVTNEPAANVMITAEGVARPAGGRTRTDRNGRYQLRLTKDHYNIWAEADDRIAIAVKAIKLVPGETVKDANIPLVRGGFVVGRLIEAANNQPFIPPGNRVLHIAHHGPARPKTGAAVTLTIVNPDGTYRLRVAPGVNYVYLMGNDASTTVTVKDGEEAHVDLRLGEVSTGGFTRQDADEELAAKIRLEAEKEDEAETIRVKPTPSGEANRDQEDLRSEERRSRETRAEQEPKPKGDAWSKNERDEDAPAKGETRAEMEARLKLPWTKGSFVIGKVVDQKTGLPVVTTRGGEPLSVGYMRGSELGEETAIVQDDGTYLLEIPLGTRPRLYLRDSEIQFTTSPENAIDIIPAGKAFPLDLLVIGPRDEARYVPSPSPLDALHGVDKGQAVDAEVVLNAVRKFYRTVHSGEFTAREDYSELEERGGGQSVAAEFHGIFQREQNRARQEYRSLTPGYHGIHLLDVEKYNNSDWNRQLEQFLAERQVLTSRFQRQRKERVRVIDPFVRTAPDQHVLVLNADDAAWYKPGQKKIDIHASSSLLTFIAPLDPMGAGLFPQIVARPSDGQQKTRVFNDLQRFDEVVAQMKAEGRLRAFQAGEFIVLAMESINSQSDIAIIRRTFLDPRMGYAPLRTMVSFLQKGKPTSQTHLVNVTWKQQEGVWVPSLIEEFQGVTYRRERRSIRLDWKSVNQPVSAEEFDLLKLSTGSTIQDHRGNAGDTKGDLRSEERRGQETLAEQGKRETKGEIRGTIHDEATKQPIADAEICVIPRPDGSFTLPLKPEKVVSDAKGEFMFPNVEPGTHLVYSFTANQTSRLNKFKFEKVEVNDQGMQQAPVQLTMKAGVTLRVRVKSETTEKPLSNAFVQFRWTDLTTDHFPANDQGEIVIPNLTAEQWHVEVAAPGRSRIFKDVKLTAEETVIDVSLSKGGEVQGTVLDEEGQPLAGASVSVEPDKHSMYDFDQTKTDEKGRFRLAYIPEDQPLRIHVSADGFQYQSVNHRANDADPQFKLKRIPDAGNVTGKVVNLDGKPIAGAQLSNQGMSSAWVRETVSGKQGEFTLEHLYFSSRGNPTLVVRAEGYAPQEVTVTAAHREEGEPLVLMLQPGHKIRGRVVDPQGKPVAGSRIFYSGGRHGSGIGGKAVADAEGRFEVTSLPQPTEFVFTAKGFSLLTTDQLPLDQEEAVTVKMSPMGIILGKVVDAKSKQPIKDFTVRIAFTQEIPPGGKRPSSVPTTRIETGESFVTKDGRFELEGFDDGDTFDLLINARGYQRQRVESVIAVPRDKAESLSILLE